MNLIKVANKLELLEYNNLLYNSFVVKSDSEIGYYCVVPPENVHKGSTTQLYPHYSMFMVYQYI